MNDVDPSRHAKYRHLIEGARSLAPLQVAVVRACNQLSLQPAVEAAGLGLLSRHIDIARFPLVDAPHNAQQLMRGESEYARS